MKNVFLIRAFAIPLAAVLGWTVLLAGCRTLEPADPYVPVREETGRLRWVQPSGDRLIADVHFSTDEERRSRLWIGKHSPILTLSRDRDHLSAESRFFGGRWSGNAATAPPAIREWLALLLAWEASGGIGEGKREFHTPEFRASYEIENGSLRSMTVRPAQSESEFAVISAH